MSDIFISYARSTKAQARQIADALRALGYGVWRDEDLPAHRSYTEVIEERLRSATAVVVIWSTEATRSEWVQSEADRARADRKLVQLRIDDAPLPMPFDRIQCADLAGWTGDLDAHDWRKVVASVAELIGAPMDAAPPEANAPLSLPGKPSIAVLPFTDMTGSKGEDYFADGMVEEIVTALSRVRSIFVIASGSSLSLRGATAGPQEAALRLGVRYVLEGSVRRSADRVRIVVKLIDTSSGAQIWSDRFEDTVEDVFDLQDRVALGVAGVIEPAVQAVEIQRVASRATDNMGGYDLYLRALPLQRSNTSTETFAALDLLHRAIALDPDYGSALVLAALCHNQVFIYGWSSDLEDHRRQAVALVQRALRAASDDPEVLARAAPVILLESQEDATAIVDRAVALNPGSSFAWYVSGLVQAVGGKPALAVEHLNTSMRLDPISPYRPSQLTWLGAALFEQGKFSEAVRLLRESAQLWPATPSCRALLAACYGHLGDSTAAQDALARYRDLTQSPLSTHADRTFSNPDHRKMFLDGIALAGDLSRREAPAAGCRRGDAV